ncbi:MAG: hypothetical protein P9L92_08200 [Candidatus Electryonea clarkiae]|nr:hypothetical protein [Candidatus Electryonea clarkiae]MDP8285594.1 hypothetical protein [Candidatus Electryonea clarkiae]
MLEDSELQAGRRELSFFGTITASVTHELNNVLSIVEQVAGLLEDMLAAQESGYPVKPEKLARIHERITRQTKRGVGIIKSLNSFAHGTDEPVSEFDLNHIVGNIITLSTRFAELKKVRLESEYTAEEVKITGDPFLLQQAVFSGFQFLLEDAKKDDTIVVTVSQHENGSAAQVQIKGPAHEKSNRDEPRIEFLNYLTAELGGTFTMNGSEDHRETLTLYFPLNKFA